jgi:hypothetical protein
MAPTKALVPVPAASLAASAPALVHWRSRCLRRLADDPAGILAGFFQPKELRKLKDAANDIHWDALFDKGD